ncbi:4-hydroxythreonine-4-phosphate dehydrogenase [Alloyangia pacifica]|uniref:4-hydroxythreonine-4-phosphate dehydrogenase n=1 Tax=Alloyangia pacifica TaxID=311180 RepID=A0A2U8HIF4_9RHOB|nr:4-hydroxythreonine-4-phosphate dehydrogenase PdxA [Alloyangia pacifica]AWI84806.1 4-hydroxythreonine-4-phosphate dehydrogenase [Alloyangia pacifica]
MRVALAIGDAAGIGPELAAKIVADAQANLGDLIVIGDARLLKKGAQTAGVKIDLPVISTADLEKPLPARSVLLDLHNCDPASVPPGKSSEAGGRASLQNFATALLLGKAGIAGVCAFTPFNKHSMRLARSSYVDEIGFVDAVIEAEQSGREFNVLDEVWNARVTSHIPLSKVASTITTERVANSLKLTSEVMTAAGIPSPRIGVAALNPHAGDGGNFGHEDDEVIAPAIEIAKSQGIDVTGPVPSDTVFVRAIKGGEFDAVMTMYHDQGQIAMKLIGFDRGVTLIAGYPFPIVTPAHGTAFDIAGQGRADTGATFNAIALGRKLAGLQPRPPATEEDRQHAAGAIAALTEPEVLAG